uniref:Uncharacterized protein LOC111112441 isoform X3 n=1 Tax=Crassostrea virginica TaxID=6565 RepID=A0A8B8BRR0_CRAVI|nr:uncharacterized protein LOC111112441 isoform X3 [Crassostrea virginica]
MFENIQAVFFTLLLCAHICKLQAEQSPILTKHINGTLFFTWTTNSMFLLLQRDSIPAKDWIRLNSTEYAVNDFLLWNSIDITVRVSTDPNDDIHLLYNVVPKEEKKEGESVILSWSIPYFPKSGGYTIFHMEKRIADFRRIIEFSSGNTSKTDRSKYRYISQSDNSTNISFEIKNISLEDAGYYTSGPSTGEVVNGYYLIVVGNPSTPNITGIFNVPVGDTCKPTCSSTSTSSPDYYNKLVKLSYKWFVNGTDVQNSDRDMRFSERCRNMSFTVTKNHRYNQYSCEAIEKNLVSKRSDPVQINALYEPGILSINPKPTLKNGKLTVKEGETIGPYSCSADCNPACEIKWIYKDIGDNVYDATSKGHQLSIQMVNRSISLLQCIAIYVDETKDRKNHNISLDVQYLDNPVVSVNDKNGALNHPVEIKEAEKLRLSCYVNGNPVPDITFKKEDGDSRILQSTSGEWLNYATSAKCSDIGTYKCRGESTGFNNTEKMFGINVTCHTRIDTSLKMKTLYGSKSGQDVNVTVAVPVIANPPPQKSALRWFGPMTNASISPSTVSQQNVLYKHWINSSIPIINQNYFGNYTLKYNTIEVITITINAEDVPQVPRNFTGYSYASGYINLTWVSGFDGGKVQHFILSVKDQFRWQEVANLSDPGQGRVVHYESGRLNAGQKYWYQLKSCNIINCSKKSPEITITAKAEPRLSVLLDKTFVIGASSAVVILILTIVFVLIILKRKTALNRQDNQQDGAEIADQPDVVLYAAVDKSAFQKNQNKADVVAEAVPEKKDETDTLYAVVEKKTTTEANPSAIKKESEQKNKSKKERQEGATAAEATGASGTSRNVNQDGLIYIDVDFAKKHENPDKNEKPKIHGEEDRTEYTFVDFSKRAPVVKEKPKKEEEK